MKAEKILVVQENCAFCVNSQEVEPGKAYINAMQDPSNSHHEAVLEEEGCRLGHYHCSGYLARSLVLREMPELVDQVTVHYFWVR